jgi:uncharacterized membrane protein YraQ (UPF0718 family)
MLKKVIKTPLLMFFIVYLVVSIITVGYGFNFLGTLL